MKKKYYLIDLKTGRTVAGSNSLETILKKYKKSNLEDAIVDMLLEKAYLPAEELEEYLKQEEKNV